MTRLLVFLLSLFAFCLLFPLLALAQASQPASAPMAVSWFHLHWPYILATILVIVPAVITICRRHPDSPGATRAATFLELFMEFITVVCPRGTGKTFKAPFTHAKMVKKGPPKPPILPLTIFIVLALACSSCCLFKPGTCKTPYGNCAAEKVRAEFPDAVNTIEAVLSGSVPEMVLKSLKLLEGLGVGLVVCAVQTAEAKYAPETQPASSSAALKIIDPKAHRIVNNARLYLKAKGVK